MQIDPAVFPTPLSAYPPPSADGILATLAARVAEDPVQSRRHRDLRARDPAHVRRRALHEAGARPSAVVTPRGSHCSAPPRPSVAAELLHFFGEVEVVFGLWAVVLSSRSRRPMAGRRPAHYVNDTVNYTEPLFVVVIMALASTRPIIGLAERSLHAVARLGGATPAAWWVAILTIAPLMGSFITEPAAMTIAALLLGRQFYDLKPGPRLKYATLGLLFVNVSIGGTLTHFAAPPVLMVARHWDWDTAVHARRTSAGARSLAIVASTSVYFLIFRRELRALSRLPPVTTAERAEEDTDGVARAELLAGAGVDHRRSRAVHGLDGRSTSHYPALFLGGFLFFLGFARATARVSEPRRAARAAARRLLPRRPGDPRRPAGVVDRARAREPVGTRLFFGADDPDGLQRQRADHLPGDARSEPRRSPEARGGRRRGDRRRADGDRQCPEPGRPGAARAVLRRRGRCRSGWRPARSCRRSSPSQRFRF